MADEDIEKAGLAVGATNDGFVALTVVDPKTGEYVGPSIILGPADASRLAIMIIKEAERALHTQLDKVPVLSAAVN